MARIDFLGKGDVAGHHLSVPFYTLKADKRKSIGNPDFDGNLIIHGDNLLALKALLPRYQGKVKCIYIDPPYNTGNEGWCYNDKVNSPMMKEWFEKNVNSEDQTRHDKWLCMMYPRLQLLKELLSDDGVIFISIDDNEQHRLRMIMDEIFGEENSLDRGMIIWRNAGSTKGFTKIVKNHEYILAYGKNVSIVKSLFGKNYPNEMAQDTINERLHIRRTPRNPTCRITVPKGTRIEAVKQVTFEGELVSGGHQIDIISPKKMIFKKGKLTQDTTLEGAFPNRRQIEQFFESLKNKNKNVDVYDSKGQKWLEVYFTQRGVPYHRKERNNRILSSIPDGLPNSGTNDIERLGLSFSNPKPVELIKVLLKYFSTDGDIILDSFAGSGTTAHAVLALNKEDGGDRKFILVECEDKIANRITAERVRRVIKGVPKTKDEDLKKGFDGSFTYTVLGDEIDHEKLLSGKPMPSWTALARHVFWLATGKTLDKDPASNKNFLVGKHQNNSVYLLYDPNVKFLQSNKAALTGDVADKLGAKRKPGERIIYYAAASYVSQKDMQKSGIVFCQLPWSITKQVRK